MTKHAPAASRLDPEDLVIREIEKLKSMIECDEFLTGEQRSALLERISVERQSYESWQEQYASYFVEPRRWVPDLAPAPSEDQRREAGVSSDAPTEFPRVIVFADFGGFSHRVTGVGGPEASKAIREVESMITPGVYEFMNTWTSEFSRRAWDDAMSGKHGSMLWVPFDIQGISIAQAIKLCVGEAARVFYLKPDEDPFSQYEYARELFPNGPVISNEYSPNRYQMDPTTWW